MEDEWVTYDQARELVERFVVLLEDAGIDIAELKGVETELRRALEFLAKDPAPPLSAEMYEDLAVGAGMFDFAAKVLSCSELPCSEAFKSHLAGTLPGSNDYSRISQLERQAVPDDVGRKQTELYIAALLAHCPGVNGVVELEDPNCSDGTNPDILTAWNGGRFGVAVKSVRSQHGQTIFENIKKASDQIRRSDADSGLVVINVKDRIDQAKLFNPEFPFEDKLCAAGVLGDEIVKAIASVGVSDEGIARSDADWDKCFDGRAVQPPVLFLGEAMVCVRDPHGVVRPTILKVMKLAYFDRKPDPSLVLLCHHLNHGLQKILHGKPPSPFDDGALKQDVSDN